MCFPYSQCTALPSGTISTVKVNAPPSVLQLRRKPPPLEITYTTTKVAEFLRLSVPNHLSMRLEHPRRASNGHTLPLTAALVAKLCPQEVLGSLEVTVAALGQPRDGSLRAPKSEVSLVPVSTVLPQASTRLRSSRTLGVEVRQRTNAIEEQAALDNVLDSTPQITRTKKKVSFSDEQEWPKEQHVAEVVASFNALSENAASPTNEQPAPKEMDYSDMVAELEVEIATEKREGAASPAGTQPTGEEDEFTWPTIKKLLKQKQPGADLSQSILRSLRTWLTGNVRQLDNPKIRQEIAAELLSYMPQTIQESLVVTEEVRAIGNDSRFGIDFLQQRVGLFLEGETNGDEPLRVLMTFDLNEDEADHSACHVYDAQVKAELREHRACCQEGIIFLDISEYTEQGQKARFNALGSCRKTIEEFVERCENQRRSGAAGETSTTPDWQKESDWTTFMTQMARRYSAAVRDETELQDPLPTDQHSSCQSEGGKNSAESSPSSETWAGTGTSEFAAWREQHSSLGAGGKNFCNPALSTMVETGQSTTPETHNLVSEINQEDLLPPPKHWWNRLF